MDIPVIDDIPIDDVPEDEDVPIDDDDPDYGGEIYEIPQSSYTPQLPKEKIKIELRALERHFRVRLSKEQTRNFFLDSNDRLIYKKVFTNTKGEIVYKDVYITQKNGEIYLESTLEKSLGTTLARELFNLKREVELSAKQAKILKKIEKELPTSSGISKANDVELKKILDSTSEKVEKLIKDSKETSTDDLFEFPLRAARFR